MSIIDKLKQQLYETFRYAEEHEGCNALADAIQSEYDKLCPKPKDFRYHNFQMNTVNWKYIAFNNGKIWARFMEKPVLSDYGWDNKDESEFYATYLNKELPLGIDWRLCCWSIEDAKRIHGEEE